MLARRYAALARWLLQRRRYVLGAWILSVVLAAMGASRLTPQLSSGTGTVPGSQSARVEARLHDEFTNPFAQLLVVTVTSDAHQLGDPIMESSLQALKTRLVDAGVAGRVLAPGDRSPVSLRDDMDERALLLVGLKARDSAEALAEVPHVRDVVTRWLELVRAFDPTVHVAVTGLPAVTHDLNRYSSDDTSRAEGRLMPLTLLVLVFAFGGLLAAGIPLVIGLGAAVTALGIASVLAWWLPFSIYVQNVATMLGLAVGTDYALLMVHRYRRARTGGERVEDAIATSLSTAGVAVTYSGLTVLIGLGGLGVTPLLDTRSIGLGGLLVVVVAVLAALTLVPVLLAWAGDRLDSPRWLSQRVLETANARQWEGWVNWVLRHPWPVALSTVLLLLALAFPATRLVNGYPDTHLFPPQMESVQGVEVLNRMGHSGLLVPLYVLVEDKAGPILTSRHLGSLMQLSADLRQNPLVASVASPVDLDRGLGPLQYMMLYRDPAVAFERFPLIGELFVSRDRHVALFQVIPHRSADLAALRELAKQIATRPMPEGLTLDVGGTPVFYNDYDRAVTGSYPGVAAVVLVVTLGVMAIAFRSVLVPLKAVALNLLSVGAGYGAVVMVFQFGWARWLVGMAGVTEPMQIPVLIPLLLFCIVFGLSMDYEVFLMSAIKEAYDRTGDNTQAILEGTCGTARLITSAALIMGAVFGAFAWADFVIVKMLGLGLAVAVLVDATIIRLALLPAVMKLAGRANWYPGDTARSEARTEVLTT